MSVRGDMRGFGRKVGVSDRKAAGARSGRSVSILMACGCIAVAIFFALRSGQVDAYSAVPQATPANPLREFVTTYCVGCHNERLNTGNLALDKADAQNVFNSA